MPALYYRFYWNICLKIIYKNIISLFHILPYDSTKHLFFISEIKKTPTKFASFVYYK